MILRFAAESDIDTQLRRMAFKDTDAVFIRRGNACARSQVVDAAMGRVSRTASQNQGRIRA